MRILVTGGAGFIGSHVADVLLADGHEVGVLDNLSTGKRANVPRDARLFEVDLRDRDAVFKTLSEFRPAAVTHQAAQASVAISVRDPHFDATVNVIGGLNLLDACMKAASLERFVFASTGGAIYGEVPDGTLATEDKVPTPISPYAIHKLTFERLLGVYREYRGMNAITLRYANVYGPRQDPFGEAGVVAIFIEAALSGKALRINARRVPGDDGCVRDYVYVSDVALANRLALRGELKDDVVNVGTGVPTATRELGRAIVALAGRELPLEPGPHRSGDLERSLLDPSRISKHIATPVTLSEGLRLTYAALAANRG